MRLKFLLPFALILTVSLSLFPDIANQILRIEALGWQLETRQGAFVISLLFLLAIFWLIERLISALIAGPGQLWQTLRMGSRKRREQRLRDGLALWLDMRGDQGRKAFKKARNALPEWAFPLLKLSTLAAHEQTLMAKNCDKLAIVLAARLATDPQARPRADIALRKAHLEAWLHAHPAAPLALIRMADLAIEEKNWAQAAKQLEAVWKNGLRSASLIKPQLAHAWVQLAKHESKHELEYLRKAHRITPENSQVITALGEAYLASGNAPAAEKLWLSHLKSNDDLNIAECYLSHAKEQALTSFRQLEKVQGTAALQWLQACLAHAAKLDGLAEEKLELLLQQSPCSKFWQTQAQWFSQKQQWQQAAKAYQKAFES
ncbi:MAG: heme biosynthesis HemY N-terminal domain-containing protein [Mariprofundaceae bacterium]